MERIIESVNKFSSLLSFLTVIIAVILFFVRIDSGISNLQASMDSHSTVVEKRGEMMQEIKESLTDKDRDHEEFNKQMQRLIDIQDKLVPTLVRLQITLDEINKKLEK